jgi:hypothetical protein
LLLGLGYTRTHTRRVELGRVERSELNAIVCIA